MNDLRELLQDADPIRHESSTFLEPRETQRRSLLAAASSGEGRAGAIATRRSRAAFFVVVVSITILALFLGNRLWSPRIQDVHAAVRFEVRLAEDKPGPRLREAKISGTDRSIYLHEEVVVTNSDISAARLIHVGDAYAVGIEFNKAGAKKMREATGEHIGKPVAILLDGQVVMAPVLRSPVNSSAEITDGFTKNEAEKVVKGIVGKT
ncbi:MAG TPA: hypothetical protein VNK23_08650 [Candidatus Dormibacteraeota bacterium]|nr:hypothetical protein [Candidatus Dormibacteraeota bacterium]